LLGLDCTTRLKRKKGRALIYESEFEILQHTMWFWRDLHQVTIIRESLEEVRVVAGKHSIDLAPSRTIISQDLLWFPPQFEAMLGPFSCHQTHPARYHTCCCWERWVRSVRSVNDSVRCHNCASARWL
jgi:hypothetical protein